MYHTKITTVTELSGTHITQIIALMEQIPEYDPVDAVADIRQRLYDKRILLQLLEVEGELAGFNLGYALDEQRFFSWLGGIATDWRGLGLAEQLLAAQEQWLQANGYQSVKIQTRNQYRPVLNLLIRNRYQVVDLAPVADDVSQYRLSLQKSLLTSDSAHPAS
ncbi:GNAT family N-acetyltransferase [Shewanella avicenniae]|uniref:GNAT family N-acetyltransferase n=1 Tax=Shewanella avicenniae TaxID=2814294 RepID=A0ABX7QS32_9GAMM|nr:GNAT family N-acetyltransferase [Shewanella avicenniae]QSX33805.1 GNAT family N-acetyltransferase [Shewanella avicenniae]